MTLTFNPEIYRNLLFKYQPKVIKSEEENEAFLEVVENLNSRPKLTLEEEALLELLVRLIEDFEDKHYQINASTPHSRLLHLMEARNLKQTDLQDILGIEDAAAKILERKREIEREQAEALGTFFQVDPSLFLSG